MGAAAGRWKYSIDNGFHYTAWSGGLAAEFLWQVVKCRPVDITGRGAGELQREFVVGIYCFVHQLANLGQASSALGVGGRAAAIARLLGGEDLCHDQRAAMFLGVLDDIFFGVAEAVAD